MIDSLTDFCRYRRICVSRLHDSCKLAWCEFLRIMRWWYIEIWFVLTGFFHSRFSTKMFCYCFIIMENIWSKTWHENINMLFVLNVLLSMFKWRFVKCVLFINISHQSLRILRYFDCYVNIYNLKFCE